MKKAKILLTAILGFGISAAVAAPITWELQDLTLGPDSAPVSGQFTYDAVTNQLYNIDIRSGAGQTTTCGNLDCTDRPVAGLTGGYVYDSTPFGYVPPNPFNPVGAFSFFNAADRSPSGFVADGKPILLLVIGDPPSMPGVFPILSAIEFLVFSETEPARPQDPHRWLTLGSTAAIASVAEPETALLLGLGLLALGLRRARKTAELT